MNHPRREAILLLLSPLLIAGCSSSSTTSRNGATPTPSPAAVTRFQNCGAATYTEPRPTGHPGAPGTTPDPRYAPGRPVSDDEALAAAHQQIMGSGMSDGGVVTCSVKTLSGSDIASSVPSLKPAPQTVMVVVARGHLTIHPVRGTGQNPEFAAVMFVIGTTHPLQILGIAAFPAGGIPAVLNGV